MPLSGTFLADLERIVGADGLVCSPEGRLVYECDMHTFYKGAPDAVALPTRADQVVAIVNLCRREHVPIVPRGSGTGLIGGAMAPVGGVMVGTNRMDGILEIDLPNRCATVQPGLINLSLTRAVSSHGYFFAPDPSSQMVSSIGGNVATNAGGPHCLKYGITTNHILGLELVTGAGERVQLGSKAVDRPGYDLLGAAVGSEGTFGIVTAVTVRLGWERGALGVRVAADVAERALLWKGRKEAAGAVGRLAPTYLLQDAVVPRSKLPAIMRELIAIGARHRVQIANVFHAGDGNLHPLILYDDRVPEELERAKAANEELLLACIAMGGTVTGEHGIGLDKAKNLPFQYADADLNFMYRLRRAFDPDGIMNPGKLLPSHPACGEGFRPARPRVPDGAWI